MKIGDEVTNAGVLNKNYVNPRPLPAHATSGKIESKGSIKDWAVRFEGIPARLEMNEDELDPVTAKAA